MRQKIFKINIPLTFDEHVVSQLLGKNFASEQEFSDWCQDTMRDMVKKACESDAIFYMMEMERIENRNDIN